MKRMGEFQNITTEVSVNGAVVIITGSVRVRVDLSALAATLGPKALRARGSRIQLEGGAVVVEAFGLTETVAPVQGGDNG